MIVKAAPRRGDVPYSEMAERALVAAIMLDEEQAWSESVDEIVEPVDFFTPEHRAVYRAELCLARRLEPVTLPTVAAELARQGMINEVDRLTGGTEPYLVMLCGEWMLSATGCSAWAWMIRRYAEQREGTGVERRAIAL